jgi:hypothetical protein
MLVNLLKKTAGKKWKFTKTTRMYTSTYSPCYQHSLCELGDRRARVLLASEPNLSRCTASEIFASEAKTYDNSNVVLHG